MNFTKLFVVFFLVLFLFCPHFLKAQVSWCEWPISDSLSRLKERYTLMGDDINAGDYKNASTHLHWLLVNNPNLSPSLYRKGIAIYQNLLSNTNEASLKEKYQDSLMILHDLWLYHFEQDKANALSSKGKVAFQLWQDNPEKYAELFSLYNELFNLLSTNIESHHLKTLMYLAICEYKEGNFSQIKVKSLHQEMTKVIDTNASANSETRSKWEETQNYINQCLAYLESSDE